LNGHEWEIVPISRSVEKAWDLATQLAPDLVEKVLGKLSQKPLDREGNPRRTHKLKGKLASRTIGSKVLEQWQFEFSASGRVWYCVDVTSKIVYVTAISLSHPKQTE